MLLHFFYFFESKFLKVNKNINRIVVGNRYSNVDVKAINVKCTDAEKINFSENCERGK